MFRCLCSNRMNMTWRKSVIVPGDTPCLICSDVVNKDDSISCINCSKNSRGEKLIQDWRICFTCHEKIVSTDNRCPMCRNSNWYEKPVIEPTCPDPEPEPEPEPASVTPNNYHPSCVCSLMHCSICLRISRNIAGWIGIFIVTGLFCMMMSGTAKETLTILDLFICLVIGAVVWLVCVFCCVCQCQSEDQECDWSALFCF